jgi:acyl dehydratase
MALDPDKLMRINIPDVEQHYSERDTMLYALGLGYGHDPLNEYALSYCYEKALRAVPTMPLVLAHPGFWMRDLDTGIDYTKIVHSAQELTLHGKISIAGAVYSHTEVVDIIDKGVARGAIVVFRRQLYDRATGELLATMHQSNLCRGDGGFGTPPSGALPHQPLPPESAHMVVELPTRPETALLYRLSADPNPLHVEPTAARDAGFPRPILHGLASFGVVGHAILKAVCDYNAERIRSISGRFSGPVFPGETIRTELWRDGAKVRFRAVAAERCTEVLRDGFAELNLP